MPAPRALIRQLKTTIARWTVSEWLLFVNAAVALCVAEIYIFHYAGLYNRYPLDAYYYFEMARNLVRHGTMSIRFEQGLPNKFFPGYPGVLGLASAFTRPEIAWSYLHAVLLCLAAVLAYFCASEWGFPNASALATAGLLVADPILIKWAAAPAAELTALDWMLLSALLIAFAERRDGPLRIVSCAGAALGLSIVTRPDSTYFIPIFAALVYSRLRLGRIRATAAFVLCALLPVAIVVVERKFGTGQVSAYLPELHTTWRRYSIWQQFLHEIIRFFRQPQQFHPVMFINQLTVALQIPFILLWLLSLLMLFGRRNAFLAWTLLGYVVCHAFWYYSSERFNILVLPIVFALYVSCLQRMLAKAEEYKARRSMCSAVFASYTCIVTAGLLIYAPVIINDHQAALASDGARPHLMAQVANEHPGDVWSEAGPDFAYFYTAGHVYMDANEPFFYLRPQPADLRRIVQQRKLQWVLTQSRSPGAWLEKHPELTSDAVSLKYRAHDGRYTLYSVQLGNENGNS